mmetsp:Transcript_42508/g.101162  ORF Transcript_42508/g.101162 Transcript_42508/m.101162 type:complete len:315 (-) Transcript_42508:60-1004(-)
MQGMRVGAGALAFLLMIDSSASFLPPLAPLHCGELHALTSRFPVLAKFGGRTAVALRPPPTPWVAAPCRMPLLPLNGAASYREESGDGGRFSTRAVESLRRGDLKGAHGQAALWSDVEEQILLAEMRSANVTLYPGGLIPSWSSFRPFAESVRHLFGEHRSRDSVACKVRKLLMNGQPVQRIRKGFLGTRVEKRTQRWRADISITGKKHYLGLFDAPEQAAWARDRAALAALGEPPPGSTFAQYFNFPDKAGALVGLDGTIKALGVDSNKSLRKLYSAVSDEDGSVKIHPKMLALCRVHKAATIMGGLGPPQGS